jgi:hypothetical protein
VQPFDIELIKYASTINIHASSNDFVVTFSRGRPAIMDQGKGPESALLAEPVTVVAMSPQTLKDLQVLVTAAMERYEATYGKIETDFTRERAKPGSS